MPGKAVGRVDGRVVDPSAPDLLAQTDMPGARFLDVGTGVGWLSIGMLRRWPRLRATGIEPLPGALGLARASIAAAGLADRFELRPGRAEHLADRGRDDLAFVPTAFIDPAALHDVPTCARAALKPEGWLLLAVIDPPQDDRAAAALARFRAGLWGGAALGAAGGRDRLVEAGFRDCPPIRQKAGFVAFVLARREAEAGPSARWGQRRTKRTISAAISGSAKSAVAAPSPSAGAANRPSQTVTAAASTTVASNIRNRGRGIANLLATKWGRRGRL